MILEIKSGIHGPIASHTSGLGCSPLARILQWGHAAPWIPLLLAACLIGPPWARAGMVDTVQYGQIQVGMRENEVRKRLGPPDRIQERQRQSSLGGSRHLRRRTVRTKSLVYVGTNPASGQKITTTIILENGKVVDKKRSYD